MKQIKHTNIALARKRYALYHRDRLMRDTFNNFFHREATGGILLFAATVVAVIFANVPGLFDLNGFFSKEFSIQFGSMEPLKMTLQNWINDGLMVIFFFVVGLEIKREIMVGELSSVKQASLPIAAALGGMLVPACIYMLFNVNNPETFNGWGIPMATDIAFAIGVLSLLGKRVPIAVKIFLTALAIADDLGAILVIAIFYPSHALHLDMLLIAGLIMLIVMALNALRIRHTYLYIAAGVLLWFVILKSGVHATIAGVLLAIIVPARTKIGGTKFYAHCKYLIQQFRENYISTKTMLANQASRDAINAMRVEIARVSSPMQKFEQGLHNFSMYVIMPLFALANAGVEINMSALSDFTGSISLGVIFGLVLGKPIGIFFFSFVMIKLGLAKFSQGMTWKMLACVGMVAGIGFTMSMFVSNLAFQNQGEIDVAKIAIFTASILAGILGSLSIILLGNNKKADRK